MPAPTFIQEAEVTWADSTSPKTTASFDVLAGDVLVAVSVEEAHDQPINITGGSLSWNLDQEVNVTNFCRVRLWTATVDTDKSMTVQWSENAATSNVWGGNVLTFRGSSGVGASTKTNNDTGDATVALTTTQDNSVIVVYNGDFAAVDGATRTWATVNSITPTSGNGLEVTYFRSAADYTVYGAYYTDAGAAGSKTVGITDPDAQTFSIAAVEIKGTAGAGSTCHLATTGGWVF